MERHGFSKEFESINGARADVLFYLDERLACIGRIDLNCALQ